MQTKLQSARLVGKFSMTAPHFTRVGMAPLRSEPTTQHGRRRSRIVFYRRATLRGKIVA